jgi:exodeoxyribonuclease V alpha subunit
LRTQTPSRHPETLSGLIERVTFFNEENGWAMLKVKAKGHSDPFPCIKTLASRALSRSF